MSALLGAMLLETSLKATVLLLAALLVSRFLRAASGRHQALTVALLGVLALPVVAAVVPAWSLELPGALQSAPGSTAPITDAIEVSPLGAAATVSPMPDRPPVNWRQILATAARRSWLVGVMLCVAWLAFGSWQRRRLVRTAHRIDGGRLNTQLELNRARLGIRRPVLLFITARRTLPMTWGLLRPRVLLPAKAYRWSSDRLDDVLLHELVHIARLDAAARTLSRVACALLWFHPLAWIVARRLQREQELACDDAVLAAGADAHDYATTLVALARDLRDGRAAVAASLAIARPSSIQQRISSILDPRQERRTMNTRSRLLLVGCSTVFLLALGALSPTRAAQQEPADARVPSADNGYHLYHSWKTRELTIVVERGGELLLGAAPADLTISPGGWLRVRAWRNGGETNADRGELADYQFEMTAHTDGNTTLSWRIDGEELVVNEATYEWLQPILEGTVERERHRETRERQRAEVERQRDTTERQRAEVQRQRDTAERQRDEREIEQRQIQILEQQRRVELQERERAEVVVREQRRVELGAQEQAQVLVREQRRVELEAQEQAQVLAQEERRAQAQFEQQRVRQVQEQQVRAEQEQRRRRSGQAPEAEPVPLPSTPSGAPIALPALGYVVVETAPVSEPAPAITPPAVGYAVVETAPVSEPAPAIAPPAVGYAVVEAVPVSEPTPVVAYGVEPAPAAEPAQVVVPYAEPQPPLATELPAMGHIVAPGPEAKPGPPPSWSYVMAPASQAPPPRVLELRTPERGSRWHGWHAEDGSLVQVEIQGDVTLGTSTDGIRIDGNGTLRVIETTAEGTQRVLRARGENGIVHLEWSVDGTTRPLDGEARTTIAALLERIEAAGIHD